ncbi:MAG: NADP-dependent oxidoreductase [Leptospiraceae bacterium]|nr:NADP-dependent oxidoreductase [Leptospiraceae bacterium]MCB1304685.1 NADP-dependent oxidoreductase [Leptospiraceae bacterium]
MSNTNTQIKLAARPTGLPGPECWKIDSSDRPTPEDGEVLLQILQISLDPAMRGWMNEARSYVPPVRINQVMRALTLSRVIESKSSELSVGDLVTGSQGAQEYCVAKPSELTRVDPNLAEPSKYLSVLGMTGMTAYFGLFDVGLPKAEDVVVVSGAAGAVGQIVGQLAKIHGCKTIGIAGGPEKCKYLTDEIGFDHAIDYKSQNVAKEIRRHAKKGLDVYFDNVGGEILEAALFNLNRGARIVICGAISQYNTTDVQGPRNYLSLLVNRARMEGMVVFDYADRYGEAVQKMAGWLKEGKLKSREDIVKGKVTDFPDTLLKLFSGDNFGKLILEIAPL